MGAAGKTTIAAFDTAGGALRYPEVANDRLLRKPLVEQSSMDSAGATATAGNDSVLLMGGFREYLIVDRIGLTAWSTFRICWVRTGGRLRDCSARAEGQQPPTQEG